jgi:hypothetical protein
VKKEAPILKVVSGKTKATVAQIDAKKAKTAEVPKVTAKVVVAPVKIVSVAKPVKVKVKVIVPPTKEEVKAAAAVVTKFNTAFESVKLSIEKSKFSDTEVVIQTPDRISAKQYAKIKAIGGKKLELTVRGELWILTYR